MNQTNTEAMISTGLSRRSFLGVALAGLTVRSAWAADYPTRPVRLIVPWAPGALVDNSARILGEAGRIFLGQPFIVENKPGASGAIGASEVARATPDGYTLLVASAAQMTIAPFFQPKLPYSPTKDLVPVMQVAEEYELLVGNKDLAPNTIQELIAYIRSRPGQINFSSAGIGSVTHLLGEMFKARAGLDMVHIPYRGGAPAVQAVLAGQVSLTFASASSTRNLAKDGQVKLFAIPARKRSRWVPDVPTFEEAGVTGMDIPFWVGLVAPARTPEPVLAKLHDDLGKALHDPTVGARFETLGIEVVTGSSEEFASLMKDETARWSDLISTSKIQMQ